MDFITRFSKTMKQHDSIIVIMDRLTKISHFIPVKSMFLASDVAQLSSYISPGYMVFQRSLC